MRLSSSIFIACAALSCVVTAKPAAPSTSKPLTSSVKTTTVSTKSSTTTKTSSSTSKKLTTTPSSVATTYDINFDERAVSLVAALNDVGLEDTILFNAWLLNQPLTTVGIPPHTSPNEIVTAIDQQAVNGTPSLTILYLGSKLKSFDLISFWFCCAANNAQGDASPPIQCMITVAGFRDTQEVAVASYTFSPPVDEVSAPMIKAVLPKTFTTVQNVTIIQGDPTLQVIVCDDFSLTTHS